MQRLAESWAAEERRRARAGRSSPEDELAAFVESMLGECFLMPEDPQPAPLPPAASAAAAAASAQPAAVTLQLKLHDVSPGSIPEELQGSLATLFSPPPLALCGHARPGCTILTVDVVADGVASEGGAAAAAAALLASPAGDWLRGRRWAIATPAGPPARFGPNGESGPAPKGPPERLSPLRPLVASTGGAELRCAAPAEAAAVWARMGGVRLPGVSAAAEGGGLRVSLPSGVTEGAALFALRDAAGGWREAAPRPVLLCPDARVVAELGPGLEAEAHADEAAGEALTTLLGCALEAGAPPPLLARAAEAALRRGWAAAAERLLGRLVAAGPTAEGAQVAQTHSLLLAAATSGRAPLVELVIRLGGPSHAFGGPITPGPGGETALHAAARHADGEAAALLAAAPRAALSFFSARGAGGETAAALALRAPAGSGLARLRERLAAEVGAAASAARGALASARAAHPAAAEERLLRVVQRGAEARSPLVAEMLSTALSTRRRSAAAMARRLSPAEMPLFAAEQLAAHRMHVSLLLLPLLLLIDLSALKSYLTEGPPEAETLALLPYPPWPEAVRLYKWVGVPMLALKMPATVAVMLLVSLPHLRGLYERRGHSLLLAYTLAYFFLSLVYTEWAFRRQYGDMFFPLEEALLINVVFNSLICLGIPLNLRTSLALLALRMLLSLLGPYLPVAARCASLPGWGTVRQLAYTALVAAVRVRQDRRQQRAWLRARELALQKKAA